MNTEHRIRELEELVVRLIVERDTALERAREMETLVRREICLLRAPFTPPILRGRAKRMCIAC